MLLSRLFEKKFGYLYPAASPRTSTTKIAPDFDAASVASLLPLQPLNHHPSQFSDVSILDVQDPTRTRMIWLLMNESTLVSSLMHALFLVVIKSLRKKPVLPII